MAEDKLLTIEQVAERLQLKPHTVRKYIREKKLTPVRISATVVRIRESELERFINEHTGDDKGS